jgi:site-specific recombinase XerD
MKRNDYVSEEEKHYLFSRKLLPRLYTEFIDYQYNDKGLARGTVHNLKIPVLRFLQKHPNIGIPSGVQSLKPKLLHDYVTVTSKSLSRTGVSKLINGLREYCRFLFFKSYHKKDLSFAIPSIVIHRLMSLDRGLTKEQVTTLLKVPDRKTLIGKRDYAILLILAIYGVRQGQLIALKMKDINWKEKTIHFKAVKGGKDVTFPLYPNVAEALLDYFKAGRSDASKKYSEVFLKVEARKNGKNSQTPLGRALWYMIKRRFDAAGIREHSYGPKGGHSLRHSVATFLVEGETPIKEIADYLGHRRIDSSFRYTKVNLNKLRKLCIQWPGGRSC